MSITLKVVGCKERVKSVSFDARSVDVCPRAYILNCVCGDVEGSQVRVQGALQSVMNVQEWRKDTGRKLRQIREQRNKEELRNESGIH